MKKFVKSGVFTSAIGAMKVSLVAAMVLGVTGCAAISEKDAQDVIDSGSIIYMRIHVANQATGRGISEWTDCSTALCGDMKNKVAGMGDLNQYWIHSGNIKSSVRKIIKGAVIVPKNVNIKNGDIVKGYLQATDTLLKFSGVVAHNNGSKEEGCYWDGTGVICQKENWDYRQDLPGAWK